MKDYLMCPNCGKKVVVYRNPYPTVDVIIELPSGIVLIKRKNPPFGWALPGGFINYGESAEVAAVREALEEVSLKVRLKYIHGVYSDPRRDPRHHSISIVFVGEAEGEPVAKDDAAEVGIFTEESLPSPIVFDHKKILKDYFRRLKKPEDSVICKG
jgi:ADP-ribose pyrophosphatase YjhB (NUDIX family)